MSSPSLLSPLREYALAVHAKFSTGVTGEPKDQLRAPFEALLIARHADKAL